MASWFAKPWLPALAAALALLGGCQDARVPPRASNGAIDLGGWNFREDGIAALDGQWLLAWDRFVEPGTAMAGVQPVEVPGPWNDTPTTAGTAGPDGHATYRLSIACRNDIPLALSLPVQHSAARWFVNGVEVARQGRPGADPQQAQAGQVQQIAQLGSAACPLDVVVHVSNFDVRRGGLMRSVELGDREQLAQRRERAVMRDTATIGGLLVMGVLPLLFFLLRRKDPIPMYFGLFCLSFAFGMGLSGTRLYQPVFAPLGWNGYLKVAFIAWYGLVTMFALFVHSLYPQSIGPRPMNWIRVWALASCVAVLLTPSSVFSYLAPAALAGAAAVAVFLGWKLAALALGGRRSAGWLLAGLLAFVAAIAHDTVNFQHVTQLALVPYGVVLFVLPPAWQLARRFSRALSVEERLAIEQRERADLLVRSTKAGVLDWDAITGRIAYSDRYREMLGYPSGPGASDPPPFRELLHPDEHDRVHGSFMRQLRDRSVRSAVRSNEPMDYRLLRADGDYLWIHAEAVSVCDDEGRTLRFICSFIDISQAKRHELEMGNQVKFTNDLFDSVPLGLALRDPQGRYLFVNRTWETYIGIRREAVIGMPPQVIDAAAADSELALGLRSLAADSGVPAGSREFDYRGRRYIQTCTVMVDAQGERIGVLAASLDISEKYAVEQALAGERERLRLLVRSTKAGFGDWDAVRDVVTYSDRFKEMLGWPADFDTAAWPSLFEMMHPDDRQAAQEKFRQMIRRKPTAGEQPPGDAMSYRLRRRDGSYIWIYAEGIAQVDESGRTRRFITSYLDVTAFREQEAALRRSRDEIADRMKFINDLVDALPLALAMRDTRGRYVFANRTWEQYYQADRSRVIGATVRDQFSTQEADSAETLDRAALAAPDRPLHTASAPLRGRDYTQWRTVMKNARAEPVGVVIATQDVTEQRATQRALASEQHRIELVVRAARVGIVDWDGKTHDTYYSPRFREIRGYAPDADTAGWPDYFKVMIHPDDRERVTRRWVTFIKGKGPEGPKGEYYSPEEYRLLRADGSYTWVQVSGMAVRDEAGLVLRWIAAIIDITERREQQEALRESHDQIAAQAALLERQNETLKENVRLREEVERIGRHDIKTPLNSIVAVPRLLREERRLGPEADELLGIVERAGYRILSMVNLSLDLYKIEQGSYVFRPDAVDLADLVGKVLADVRMHAASKRVKLAVNVARGLYAWAEELLCYSLLANLLKNAVEASPEDATVTVDANASGGHMLLLRIHNDGAVPPALRANFFQKHATLGKASGTGLGTYSARLMARVQDGDIEMESSDLAGTTLSVRLRAAPDGAVPATVRHVAERRAIEPLLVATLPPMRVLLVDDDEYNLLIVRRFLPDPPFTVGTAINGRVALSSADLQWPDVIFMDLDMPVMGGLEAVRELRAMESDRKLPRCTMVALSSHDDDATRQLSLDAGFDRYLTKPVTREAIHQTLLELKMPAAHAPATGSASAPVGAPVPGMADEVVLDEDVQAVLPDFMVSRKALIADMRRAMDDGDRGKVRRIAHQLTGSFGLYGFRWASEQARSIESSFEEIDPQDLGRRAGRLCEHLDSVVIRFGNS